jgi:hypothetical protein
MPLTLYPRGEKETPVPLDRKLYRPQNQYESYGEKKNVSLMLGIELRPPRPWPVSIQGNIN